MMVKKAPIILLASVVLLGVIIAAALWQTGFFSRSAPPEKITIGSSPGRLTGLFFISQEQGYFKAQGLDVTLKPCTSSVESMKALRAGQVDLACLGVFTLVEEVCAGASNLRCLAILANGQIMDVMARRDRGISRPADLRGKTIGVTLGLGTHFYLGRFLTLHQIPYKEVTIVDVKSSALGDALATGKVDAVVVWEPIILKILKKMGNAVVTWPSQEGQDIFWVMVGRQGYLKRNPAAVEKLLRALERAAKFVKEQPTEAKEIICRRANFPLEDWDRYPLRYDVFLDQGLLLHMEDEAAWMIHNRITNLKEIPNFMDYLDPGPLLKVNPKAVRLALPGLAPPK
jgi:ABC-type nitrate/sulfonate/bicarbonate transport system substrate-binding protein